MSERRPKVKSREPLTSWYPRRTERRSKKEVARSSREMVGSAMRTMFVSSDAMSVPRVVLERTIHLYCNRCYPGRRSTIHGQRARDLGGAGVGRPSEEDHGHLDRVRGRGIVVARDVLAGLAERLAPRLDNGGAAPQRDRVHSERGVLDLHGAVVGDVRRGGEAGVPVLDGRE